MVATIIVSCVTDKDTMALRVIRSGAYSLTLTVEDDGRQQGGDPLLKP